MYYLQSRYYNPTIGRFINADDPGYLGADGTVISYNLFAYCSNNPIIRMDHTGYTWNEFLDEIIAWIRGRKEAALHRADGTSGAGINLSFAAGLAAGTSVGYTYDRKGNIGVFATVSGGGGFPSASASLLGNSTTAPDIYGQSGLGVNIGGSGSAKLSVGGEYNILINTDKGIAYHGATVNAGIGFAIPSPVELHGEVGYTFVKGVNVYDLALGFLEWIR